jgi:phage terminase small subunit
MELTTKKPSVNYKDYSLNSKQAKFVNLLMTSDLSQGKCYQKIYGTKSDSSAIASAARLLGKDNVQAYKEALEANMVMKVVEDGAISKERVLQEEACIAFLDIGALVDDEGFFIQNLKHLPEEVRRAITGLEISEKMDPATGQTVPYYKLKFSDKGRSLERLEKHLGMMRDRLEIGVEVTLKGLLAHIDGKAQGKPMIPHLGADRPKMPGAE